MKISRKLENLFSAAAFAEEGEFETARQMATEETGPEKTASPAKKRSRITGRRRRVSPSTPKA